jgi:hypothetical protein
MMQKTTTSLLKVIPTVSEEENDQIASRRKGSLTLDLAKEQKGIVVKVKKKSQEAVAKPMRRKSLGEIMKTSVIEEGIGKSQRKNERPEIGRVIEDRGKEVAIETTRRRENMP